MEKRYYHTIEAVVQARTGGLTCAETAKLIGVTQRPQFTARTIAHGKTERQTPRKPASRHDSVPIGVVAIQSALSSRAVSIKYAFLALMKKAINDQRNEQ